MQADWVVKAFDVIANAASSLFVGLVSFVTDFFGLVALEEGFHRRIVVAVSSTTHTL